MTSTRRQVALVVVFVLGAAAVLYAFRSILVPFVLAVVLAYVLGPVVAAMARIGSGRPRMPRWVAVLILFFGLLSGLAAFSIAFLPRLGDEIGVMMREVPAAFRHVREEWLPAINEAYEEKLSPFLRRAAPDAVTQAEPADRPAEAERQPAVVLRPARDGSYRIELRDLSVDVRRHEDGVTVSAVPPQKKRPADALDLERSFTSAMQGLLERGQEHVTVLLSVGQEVVLFLIGFTFAFFITLMIAAFILTDQERILRFFESLVPDRYRGDYRSVLEAVDRGLAGVIRGQLLICLINGTLSGIGFALLDLRYWPVLTAIATVLTLIPIFGTIASSVPAVLIGLIDSPLTGMLTLAWITAIHLIEANVLNPKILGVTARIHPVIVFFALIAGMHAAGLLGALLGVPVASILQNIFLFFRGKAFEKANGGDSPGNPIVEGRPSKEP